MMIKQSQDEADCPDSKAVPQMLRRALEAGGEEMVRRLVVALEGKDTRAAHQAARVLKKIAEQRPELLTPCKKQLLRAACANTDAMRDVRTRWQMTIVLGHLPLRGSDRAVVVDLLFERLREDSPLQKTFAMQALFNLSAADEALRSRVMPVIRPFAEDGTAAMRARARRLLRQSKTLSTE